jgi:hypothetical protein
VYLRDGHRQIDADGEGSGASKQAKQDEQSAEKLGERREIPGPGRQSETGHEVRMLLQSAENLVVSVANHYGTQGESHDEQCERLQPIEVAQGIPP